MNEIIKLILELQDIANHGFDVDDAKLQIVMQTIQNTHDDNINNNILLSEKQKKRRKELYQDCVKTMEKYAKQSLQDDKEIRNLLLNLKR